MPSASIPSSAPSTKTDPGISSPDARANEGKSGQQAGKQKAAEDLKTAGEQISQAGEDLGDSQQSGETGESDDASQTGGGADLPPLFPDDLPTAGNEPADTLIPDSDAATEPTDELVFDENNAENTAAANADNTDLDADLDADLEAEIEAAQDALITAGDALQEAAEAVASAESTAELEAAEQLLARARIAVIIASEDLDIVQQSASIEEGPESTIFTDIDIALEQANVLLVIATESIFEAKIGLPDFPDLPSTLPTALPTTTPEVSILDAELEDSLIIFEGDMDIARDVVINTTAPPPTGSNDRVTNIPIGQGVIEIPGGETEAGDAEESDPAGDPTDGQNDTQLAIAGQANEDIPDGQGDDIVAQQLREAAIAETDLDLKEKLWEEYKRYKSGL
ncbi:MAG: hypothetical protein KUG79_10720 [Pseudomonadales bacterium]|nr:hypothetical protein [Pseudomonadales bacterium]